LSNSHAGIEQGKVNMMGQQMDKTPAPSSGDAAELQRQQAALDAMFDVADKTTQKQHNDGLSGRDHDRILYTCRCSSQRLSDV
jgi:hypothetical protein